MEQHREHIERISNILEKQGLNPVSARVFVYLFIVPDGEATFEELVNYFGVSKSAISVAIKFLTLKQLIMEKTKSGSRKRYFSIAMEYALSIDTITERHQKALDFLNEILAIRPSDDDLSLQLKASIELIDRLNQMIPMIHREIFEKYGLIRS